MYTEQWTSLTGPETLPDAAPPGESEGLELLRIDERYDADDPADGIDEGDPWRPMNHFVHRPSLVGTIVRERGYSYDSGTTISDRTLLYDAMGNVMGVSGAWGASTWDYDAFGNPTTPGVWPEMDSSGPKPRLTGKMRDTDTGLYYFHARWYDPAVGRFVGRDRGQGGFDRTCHDCDIGRGAITRRRHGDKYYTYVFSRNAPSMYVDEDGCTANGMDGDIACVFECAVHEPPFDYMACMEECRISRGGDLPALPEAPPPTSVDIAVIICRTESLHIQQGYPSYFQIRRCPPRDGDYHCGPGPFQSPGCPVPSRPAGQ